MFKSKTFAIAILAAAAFTLAVTGCSEDDPTAPPTGTVVIAPPDGLDAPWTLTGPDDYETTGVGGSELTGLVPGTYAIVWGAVAGHLTPPGASGQLEADATLRFECVYAAAGTITIAVEPEDLPAPWQIAGPNGFFDSGTGDATLANLAAGTYTVTWADVDGHLTPSAESAALAEGGSLVLTGTYEPLGTIFVETAPTSLDPSWELAGPNGFLVTGSGDGVLEDMVGGSYTMTWQAMSGWTTPPAETLDLTTPGSITFQAEYTVAAASTPDQLMERFETCYMGQDLDAYSTILSEDFKWIQQEGEIWNYDQEIAIADKMFNGIPGYEGWIISDISIDQFEPQSVWTDTPENDPDFGGFTDSLYRTFVVDISFTFANHPFIFRTQGPVLFYVLDADEEGSPDFRILGIKDATFGNKAVENHSWTAVKNLFI